jgi:hypothetical protein
MAKKVYVTRVQKDAAKMLVNRSAVTGRYVSSNVRKIANAHTTVTERASHPTTTVTQQASHPTTTVTEK